MRTDRIGRWAVLPAMTAALCTAGCGGGESKNGLGRLNPRGVPFLEGVPVPGGFELVKRESTDYESGGQRNARHVYAGWADPAAVRNFYHEQMPLMGWKRVSGQNVEGNITLRFEKTTEACTVEIRPAGFLNRTRVQVTVSPFSRAAPAPAEPPRRSVP
ncbi:MAG: hypothetical protein HRF43_10435 [Phycisphaerae bacterium]